MRHNPKNDRSRLVLNVRGYLWQGTEATYTYTNTPRPALHQRSVSIHPTMNAAEVKAMAGDFESVTDWQVIEVRSGGDWSRQWTRRTVVRDWSLQDSEEVFAESQA